MTPHMHAYTYILTKTPSPYQFTERKYTSPTVPIQFQTSGKTAKPQLSLAMSLCGLNPPPCRTTVITDDVHAGPVDAYGAAHGLACEPDSCLCKALSLRRGEVGCVRERCSLIFVAPLALSEERPDSVAGSPHGYSAAEILPD